MKIHIRQPWTNREDQVLKASVTKYGFQNWGRVASVLTATNRTAQECESRWFEYLAPNINHGEWTKEEEDLLEELVDTWGSNWRTIAQQLRGRTATQCMEKHGHLLTQAARSGGAGSSTSKSDDAAFVFHQSDNRNEVRAPRQDTVDADSREKIMLDEARARLANTKGRKDLRKEKERAMLAAKQRSEIQRQREMKAAAAVVEGAMMNRQDDENDSEEDFVPISTSDVDRAGLGKKRKQSHKIQHNNASSSMMTTEEEIRQNALKLAAKVAGGGKEDDDDANVVDKLMRGNNAATSAFSFGSNINTGRIAGNTAENDIRLITTNNNNNNNSNNQLLVPRTLQEKRAKQEQQLQLMKLRQQNQLTATSSASSKSSQQQQQHLSSSILSAIQDGGRTKREKEAMLRNGATLSFVKWLGTSTTTTMNENQNTNNNSINNNNNYGSSIYHVPDHRAIQRVVDNSYHHQFTDDEESKVEFLILNELIKIAREDNNNNNESATVSENSSDITQSRQQQKQQYEMILNTFNFSSSYTSSSGRTNINNNDSNNKNISLFSQWAEQCATPDLVNAANMIEQEYQRTKTNDNNSNNNSNNNFPITTPLHQDMAVNIVNEETAAIASAVTDAIFSHTAEFKNFYNNRFGNTTSTSTNGNNKESSSMMIAINDFARVCQDSAQSHDEAEKSKMMAAVTNRVRIWEEECLKAAYDKLMEQYRRAKEERDVAEQKLFQD